MKIFNSKIISKLFIAMLLISVLIFILPPKLKLAVYTPNILGYLLLGAILLTILLLIILLIINIRNNGLLKGIKETSLHIFLFSLGFVSCYFVAVQYKKQSNKVDVVFINNSKSAIYNLELFGRNNQVLIDTLVPNDSSTSLFYGKNPNLKLENDYGNEVEIRFYHNKGIRERKVLKGFSRWRVLPDKLKITIHSSDSLSVETE
jgi:hypothetical protein